MKHLMLLMMALTATAADKVTDKLDSELSRLEQSYQKKKRSILTDAVKGYEKLKIQATKAGDLDKAIKYKAQIDSIKGLLSRSKADTKSIDYALKKRGAMVSATSGAVNHKWPLSSVIDGVTSSKVNYTAVKLPCSIILDLGKVRKADQLTIHLFDFDTRYYGFKVYTSRDGKRWFSLAQRSRASGQQSFPLKHPIRYVKVNGYSNTIGDEFHIKEIEVKGKE